MSRPALSELDLLDYPWLQAAERTPWDGTPVDACSLVVSVGCNAAPLVLREKLNGASVPTASCTVTDLAVGHSAHVSARGYIAAAPFRSPGTVSALHAAWLSESQLRALDSTEPNYVRTELTADRHQLVVDGMDEPPARFAVYVSRWGVLATGGVPITFRGQRDLHRALADVGADLGVIDPDEPVVTIARLQQPETRDRLRAAWASRDLVRPADLDAHDGR